MRHVQEIAEEEQQVEIREHIDCAPTRFTHSDTTNTTEMIKRW